MRTPAHSCPAEVRSAADLGSDGRQLQTDSTVSITRDASQQCESCVQVAKAAPATADVLSEQIEGAAQRVAEEAPKAADRATKQIEVRTLGVTSPSFAAQSNNSCSCTLDLPSKPGRSMPHNCEKGAILLLAVSQILTALDMLHIT